MGLAERVPAPYVHEGLLLVIALVLVGACVVGALLLRRLAPAVSIGLVGAVVVGTIAFFVSAAQGPRGVPHDVGVWGSIGLWAGGTVGLVVARPRPAATPLWHAGVTCLVLAPFGAALLFLSASQACPEYVTRGAGYCFYDFDMLGGWASGLSILFVLDVIVVATLLFISGEEAKDDPPAL